MKDTMSQPVTGQPELDDIDQRIIGFLRENGRATNQELARRLRISAATVSARIRRLEQSKAMKVVAVTDFAALGYNFLLAVGIQVQGRPAGEVARDLAKLKHVFAAHLVTGARDIEVLLALHDYEELHSLLLDEIAKIKGIRTIECGIAVDVVKFNFDVAPIS